ncbi:MAG: DUF2892 domain-containing protein, partial [Rhodothermales bacterium]|nr:DUF2892 domain-containing protein [Rhodothermales bacterium]
KTTIARAPNPNHLMNFCISVLGELSCDPRHRGARIVFWQRHDTEWDARQTIDSQGEACAMKKNMGSVDRIARILIAVVIAVLYFTDQITGTAAIILGIIAIVFLLTSLVGSCPAYLPFGLSTRKAAE